MADDKINSAMRVTVKQVVRQKVVPDRRILCGHASVDVNDGTASIDFTGSVPDPDGWQLIHAVYTNVVSVTREVRADGR